MKCKVFCDWSSNIEKQVNEWFAQLESELVDFQKIKILSVTQSASTNYTILTIIYEINK